MPEGMDLPELALRFILRAPGRQHDDSRDAPASVTSSANLARERRRAAAAAPARRAAGRIGGTDCRRDPLPPTGRGR